MDRQTLYARLLTCNEAQIVDIMERLAIGTQYVRAGPVAVQAADIAKLAEQRNQLAALDRAIRDVIGGGPVPPAPPQADPQTEKQPCILILAANPMSTQRLRLDQEVKRIERILQTGEQGRKYHLEVKWAVSADELSGYLLKYQPTVVHFSGHGSETGRIMLEGENGDARPVPAEALAGLFETLKGTELVVLNACYSLEQGKALAQAVPKVVGMSRSIGDESAIRFAEGFYEGLAHGKDYDTAFRLGCLKIDLAALPDSVVPHVTTRDDDRMAVKRSAAATPDAVTLQVSARVRGGGPAAAVADEEAKLFPLYYGTNRRPRDVADPNKGYSGERDDKVHFGICRVVVPKSHEIGSTGSPWWKRLLKWEDDRLKLVEVATLSEAACWKAIKADLAAANADERRALVYIHGFNVSFEEAALRAAQIGADVKLPGITAFFSWPSKGSPLGYTSDEATIEASEGHIAEFLTGVADKSGAKRVDIIAHSMGNRGVLRAFQRILQKASRSSKTRFGHIVLAAPDVDAAIFRDLAAAYGKLSERTTLYVSSKDKALAASAIIHDYPRAGFSPPVLVLKGIDTIEVSNIDLTFLGHGYFAGARDVLHDIHELIMHGAPPKSRHGLDAVKSPAGQYWRIQV